METLKDSVSKCHIKCINIDGNKCDNIEDICNNFNNHFRQWLNASSKIPT